LMTLPTTSSGWRPAPPDPVLAEGDVHVWAISLESGPGALQRHFETIAPDERERAARFIFDVHRHRYVTCRGTVRRVLAGYLRVRAEDLVFVVSPLGKPALASLFSDSGIHFNVSHSENMALVAVTRIGPVGVDVELVRQVKEMDHLVKRFFSLRENERFQKLAEAEKPSAFFNLWTRKEALLKATGVGITKLSTVEVSFLPGEDARVLAFEGDPEKARQWQLEDCAPAPGYAGAVAIRAPGMNVRCWTTANLTPSA